jgi:hypothetical protein
MSDEIRITTIAMTEVRRLPAQGIDEHWCMHEGCRKWGSFGFDGRFGTTWFCGDHQHEGKVGR